MSSKAWKSGFIAVFVILLNCVNEISPPLHPLMTLKVERVNTASRVIIATTVAEHYSMYRIVDNSCTLTYPWSATTSDSTDSAFIASVAIANDSAASQSGAFHGIWEVPDSLFKYGPIRIYACAVDETNHSVCAALELKTN